MYVLQVTDSITNNVITCLRCQFIIDCANLYAEVFNRVERSAHTLQLWEE